MNHQEVFHSGQYHSARQTELTNPHILKFTNTHLDRSYERASQVIEAQSWQNPVERSTPHILQMGIEGYNTAFTFKEFIHQRNPHAKITVADVSAIPLNECRERGLAAYPNIQLVQADTTDLQFPNNSFDLIETDGLLQFLSPDEKRKAVREWHRVLKKGGIVTTRDRFVSMHDPIGTWDTLNAVRSNFKTRFGTFTYPTTTEVMRYTFTAQGFDTVLQKEEPQTNSRILLHDIIARKV